MFLGATRGRLSDDAARHVRRLIDERGLRPGDRLPAERDLARQLGVGRTSLREGLRTLEILGMIDIVPGKGMFLKEGAAAPFDRVLRRWAAEQESSMTELIELREPVETQTARLAAERATDNDVAALERTIDGMRQAIDAGNVQSFVDADCAFHDAIARASGNTLLRRVLNSIERETLTFRFATASIGHWIQERTLAEHRAIWNSIRQRDSAAARRAMREHILVWTRAHHAALRESSGMEGGNSGALRS